MHFTLPDQTESTLEFKVVDDANEDCELSDPVATVTDPIQTAITVYFGEDGETRGPNT